MLQLRSTRQASHDPAPAKSLQQKRTPPSASSKARHLKPANRDFVTGLKQELRCALGSKADSCNRSNWALNSLQNPIAGRIDAPTPLSQRPAPATIAEPSAIRFHGALIDIEVSAKCRHSFTVQDRFRVGKVCVHGR